MLWIKDLTIGFPRDHDYILVVRNFNLHIHEGEIVGLAGESGCGKSMTALAILNLTDFLGARILKGQVLFENQDLLKSARHDLRRIRGKDISMIFQDPFSSLNPSMTVFCQIAETLAAHTDYRRPAIRTRVYDLLKKVRIEHPRVVSRKYPHELSGGMQQRVMIAMAIACGPKLLIADEPTTALDMCTQLEILTLLKTLRQEERMAMLLISHDLELLKKMCGRVAIMYAGTIVEEAPTSLLYEQPRHPYTRGLIQAVNGLKLPGQRLKSIPGNVPDAASRPGGCPFHPRCPAAIDQCRCTEPDFREISARHFVRCYSPWHKCQG